MKSKPLRFPLYGLNFSSEQCALLAAFHISVGGRRHLNIFENYLNLIHSFNPTNSHFGRSLVDYSVDSSNEYHLILGHAELENRIFD